MNYLELCTGNEAGETESKGEVKVFTLISFDQEVSLKHEFLMRTGPNLL